MAEILETSAAGATIPLFSYSTTASRDGNRYSGQMVGRSPFFHGHRLTNITAFLIPVKLTFQSDSTVFDPTVSDSCAGGKKVVDLVTNSPIFQNATYTMNGDSIGNTQYVDAFERANFWSKVSGTPYHTMLSPVTTILQAVSLSVPTANGFTAAESCGRIGEMDINWWDNEVQSTILPSLASVSVGPTSFPIFLFDSVIMCINGLSGCGVAGYHNAFFTSGGTGPLQTYSVTTWDTTGLFDGDIAVTSHEAGEWMDDPLGTNPTPAWGHIGQVRGCQNNLEVGDPLTGTAFPAVTLGGFTYHPQELAFFSWFYGAPSVGAGGRFSDNGSFSADAGAVCF